MQISQIDPAYWNLLWSVLVAAVVALLAVGRFHSKVATKDDLEKTEKEMLQRLYDNEGSTIFIPRKECRDKQTSCGKLLCAKLDELKADSQRRHREQLEEHREHMRRHEEISLLLGAVQQFMENHKKEG